MWLFLEEEDDGLVIVVISFNSFKRFYIEEVIILVVVVSLLFKKWLYLKFKVVVFDYSVIKDFFKMDNVEDYILVWKVCVFV